MAEDAKNSAADEAVNEKGQAKDEQNPPKKRGRKSSAAKVALKQAETSGESTKKVEEIPETEIVEDKPKNTEADAAQEEKPKDSDKSESKKKKSKSITATADATDFQAEVRDQIENCKFEIISSLQESVHRELKDVMQRQIRKTERRRVRGVIIRDIFILILAAIVGYFGYCLYDAQYFDFWQPVCEQSNNCNIDKSDDNASQPEPEEVKDFAWYRKNYGDLFNNIQTNLNADTVSAYYLYSGDYRVVDIPTSYLLGMSYNQLAHRSYSTDTGLIIPADDLRLAFINTFGNADYFTKRDFTYDCQDFTYDKTIDAFTAPSVTCVDNSNRVILEEVTDIYEEGNVLYFLTVATIFDRSENSFYTFDNFFRPIATDVSASDLDTYSGILNKYQYQFKRANGDRYYFSGITKLK